jgi:uncharacterized protein (DUF433 family)
LESGIIGGDMNDSTIVVDPEVQGGVPCFAGTRVPVKSLFDAIDRGRSVTYFLEQFPAVKPQQVHEVLRQAEHLVTQLARGTSAA